MGRGAFSSMPDNQKKNQCLLPAVCYFDILNATGSAMNEEENARGNQEIPAGGKSKRGRPAGSKNNKKPCSQIENRNVEGPAGGGGQEEAMKRSQMQLEGLLAAKRQQIEGLLAAKREYNEAIVSINKCVDAGALTSGEAEAQRAKVNAAKEAAGIAATRTDIGKQEGEEKENPAGEKSKRGRPAGSKNANKTRIDDLSDATLAAVCADLDLAPAVGSESSVREQRMRCMHAASGSTAKLPQTSLDGLSVATLKFICADRKLPTCGEDMERQVYIDRILAGLPGKKRSSQLENRNVGGHTASVDLKVDGGGGGQEAAMLPLLVFRSCSIDKDRDKMPLKDMSAGKQPTKNNITAADDTLHEKKAEESQKGQQTTIGHRKKARTTPVDAGLSFDVFEKYYKKFNFPAASTFFIKLKGEDLDRKVTKKEVDNFLSSRVEQQPTPTEQTTFSVGPHAFTAALVAVPTDRSELILELARSGQSTCKVCFLKIAKGEPRVGIEHEYERFGGTVSWHHHACFSQIQPGVVGTVAGPPYLEFI